MKRSSKTDIYDIVKCEGVWSAHAHVYICFVEIHMQIYTSANSNKYDK